MTDSPAGLAALMLVHPGFAEWSVRRGYQPNADQRRSAGQLHALLAHQYRNVRGTGYWENRDQSLISAGSLKTGKIAVPVAVSIFPEEVYQRRRRGRAGRTRL